MAYEALYPSPLSTKLTFYGGLDEIGGNKILLEDHGTKVFLDFGKSFSTRSRYYEWTSGPRLANGIGDFVALGILPDIKGIYRKDLLQLARLPCAEDKFVDGVILTHAHADHADYISFLREDIPIWMGATCRAVISALEQEKNADVEFEITKFKERPAKGRAEPLHRKIETFRTGSKVKIDSIEIEPVHVDHSLPGCYGFVIHTSSSTIIYSGDLRIHGNRPDLTTDFINKSCDSKPEWMLCEGTRMGETTISSSEKEVFEICLHYARLRDSGLFLFADYSYKDVDRFLTFYKVAKATGRKILITPKTARYISRLAENNPDLGKALPPPTDDSIGIYKNRIKSGTYSDEDYDDSDLDLYKQTNVWTSDDVRGDSSKVIMAIGPYHLNELIDLNPRRGIYIHSASEPFNEEGEINEKRIDSWVGRFGLAKIQAHCSGHASGPDLNRILEEISPKKIIPIHTEQPELFEMFHGDKVVRPTGSPPTVEL